MAGWNVEEVCEGDPRSVGVVGHVQRLLGRCSFVARGPVLALSGQAVVLQVDTKQKCKPSIQTNRRDELPPSRAATRCFYRHLGFSIWFSSL